ncbi:MAG: hypothetical protein A2Y57_03090 [Candidatus Woykebacteria bacterium RBG_13_40_7b]|uniref:Uncharacterized protein n=1 Tax=Candidatus Woykebacteria bacterium RBG_13_40_7b TaxID=1802594 RepID=A0A1G1W8A7_9BACT|nr:MAG: hypothetical protein A2Y57_03090 [Candidatus Woykebacteria bacterium RBG_13_40_7b]
MFPSSKGGELAQLSGAGREKPVPLGPSDVRHSLEGQICDLHGRIVHLQHTVAETIIGGDRDTVGAFFQSHPTACGWLALQINPKRYVPNTNIQVPGTLEEQFAEIKRGAALLGESITEYSLHGFGEQVKWVLRRNPMIFARIGYPAKIATRL